MLLELRVGWGREGRREGHTHRERENGGDRSEGQRGMKGRQCGWQSQLEPVGPRRPLKAEPEAGWPSSREATKVFSRGAAGSQEAVPGGCAKKPGFPTPCGQDPVDPQAATPSHPLPHPCTTPFLCGSPAPIGPFSWPFLHPAVLEPLPPPQPNVCAFLLVLGCWRSQHSDLCPPGQARDWPSHLKWCF